MVQAIRAESALFMNERARGVAPVRAKASICARQAAAEPTAPRPSSTRSEMPFTAPARSPAFQALFTARPPR